MERAFRKLHKSSDKGTHQAAKRKKRTFEGTYLIKRGSMEEKKLQTP